MKSNTAARVCTHKHLLQTIAHLNYKLTKRMNTLYICFIDFKLATGINILLQEAFNHPRVYHFFHPDKLNK